MAGIVLIVYLVGLIGLVIWVVKVFFKNSYDVKYVTEASGKNALVNNIKQIQKLVTYKQERSVQEKLATVKQSYDRSQRNKAPEIIGMPIIFLSLVYEFVGMFIFDEYLTFVFGDYTIPVFLVAMFITEVGLLISMAQGNRIDLDLSYFKETKFVLKTLGIENELSELIAAAKDELVKQDELIAEQRKNEFELIKLVMQLMIIPILIWAFGFKVTHNISELTQKATVGLLVIAGLIFVFLIVSKYRKAPLPILPAQWQKNEMIEALRILQRFDTILKKMDELDRRKTKSVPAATASDAIEALEQK